MQPNELPQEKKPASKYKRLKWEKAFLSSLARTGVVHTACQLAKVDRTTAYYHRNKHPEFAILWEEALEKACEVMEEEANRRAVAGYEEPLFYKGEQCGEIRKYSDLLLIFMLKANRPGKFRENVRLEHSGPNAGPIETTTTHEHIITVLDRLTIDYERRYAERGAIPSANGSNGCGKP